MTTELKDLTIDDLLPGEKLTDTSQTPPSRGGNFSVSNSRKQSFQLPNIAPRDTAISIILVVTCLVIFYTWDQGLWSLPKRRVTSQPTHIPVAVTVAATPYTIYILITPTPEPAPPALPPPPRPTAVPQPAPRAAPRAVPTVAVQMDVQTIAPKGYLCYEDPSGIRGTQPLRIIPGVLVQIETRGQHPNLEVTVHSPMQEPRTWRRCQIMPAF